MNIPAAANLVQWLFLDLNAFFASCEQQQDSALRGKPIIVVQTLTDSACAIAASYAAKAFGIKTGTGKQPYAIALADRRLMGMAGLWETWRSPTGERIRSFTIITTKPNKPCGEL